jgi:hypothetical protein
MTDAARHAHFKANAQALSELFRGLQEPVVRAMVAVDPWSGAFAVEAQAALGEATAPLWPQMQAALPGLSGR